MKQLQVKIICITFFFLLILTVFTSTASFSNLRIQNYVLSTKINQSNIIGNESKITAIFKMINQSLLREYLEMLVNFGPRWTGTYGCKKSAEYIHHKFKENGLETKYQNWTAIGRSYNPRVFKSQNIEGTLRGINSSSDKIIIFNAHYDTVKVSPGANDDGSGTAAVLAAAYVLSHFKFEHTLKFIAFSGEEVGLLGSHAYAKESYQKNDNILVDINADMIGHAVTSEGGRRMGITATEDAIWILDIIKEFNIDYNINFDLDTGEINRDGHGWGDYHSFVEYGYETLACWGGEHDPNMHTKMDDLSNVNFSYLVNTTKIIAGILAYLADNFETFPQISIVSPKLGKLYFEGREICNINDLKSIVIKEMWIWTDVNFETIPIERAEFYYDNLLVFTDTEPPFKWYFNRLSIRNHRVTVVVYDKLGRKSTDWKDIYFLDLLKNHS